MVEKELTTNIGNLKVSGPPGEIHKLATIYGSAASEYGHQIVDEIHGKHRDNLIIELENEQKCLENIEKQLIEGSLTPSRLIAQSFLVEYMAVFIFVLIMITLFGPAFCYIDGNIPKSLHIAFKFSYFLVPWIGLSMLFISFSTKPKVD